MFCSGAKSNMQSALQCTLAVDEYLKQEVMSNCVVGPLSMGAITGLQVNQSGMIPKKHLLRKWGLIVDLSYPEGKSVNDGFEPKAVFFKVCISGLCREDGITARTRNDVS